jgi:hypothetical protein
MKKASLLATTLGVCLAILAITGSEAYAAARLQLPPSSAVSNYRAYVLINSENVVIGDLAISNSDDSDHQIRISSAGRILATTQVQISNPAGIAVRGACELSISDGTGPNNGLTSMGRPAVWYTTDNAAYDLTVTVVGYATKPAGTYNVVVNCQQLGFLGATTGLMSNMTVLEAAE